MSLITMIIDDNEVDALLCEQLLRKSGITQQVLIHTSAKSGIEYFTSIEKLAPRLYKEALPSLVLLDINMPIMDGYQFLEAFKQLNKEIQSATRVFILTALSFELKERILQQHSYVKGVLVKPLTQKSLRRL